MDALRRDLAKFNAVIDELDGKLKKVSSETEEYRIHTTEKTIEEFRQKVPATFLPTFETAAQALVQQSADSIQCFCGSVASSYFICAKCPPEARQLYCKSCSPLYTPPCSAGLYGENVKLCQSCMVQSNIPFYCNYFCCTNCNAEHPLYTNLRVKLETQYTETVSARNGSQWNMVWAYYNGFDSEIPEYKRNQLQRVVLPDTRHE